MSRSSGTFRRAWYSIGVAETQCWLISQNYERLLRMRLHRHAVSDLIVHRVQNDVPGREPGPVHFYLALRFASFLDLGADGLDGDLYSLLNIDVYVPLFAGLIDFKTPLPSVNNLQIGLFTDIAAASENYKGAIKDNKEELLWSLGFSARTILAGYPICFDMGWPGTGGKPVWYLAIRY